MKRSRERRPFTIERRSLQPRRDGKVEGRGYQGSGRPLRPALAPGYGPLADDVSRMLQGKTRFPEVLWGEVMR